MELKDQLWIPLFHDYHLIWTNDLSLETCNPPIENELGKFILVRIGESGYQEFLASSLNPTHPLE